ncbi:hypothetical protein ACIGXM_14575 [Kitasatospora sp. NPDC052896]|uniref:hypothetical protein n=1 Tax=Kitasatospora sp. NPDC052896 TaxID=3364061 RepID=UPI0037C54CC2
MLDEEPAKPGYTVVYERYSQRHGKKPKLIKKTTTEHRWSDEIAPTLVDEMKNRRDRFSGMEEFGQGSCDECDGTKAGRPCCTRAELDSCRQWIEGRLDELKDGESEDFHLTVPNGWLSYTVTYHA